MISLLDTTSDSFTEFPAALDESSDPDSTVPFVIPVLETESAFTTANAESATVAQSSLKEKRLYALQSVCLLDRDATFRQRVPEDLSYMISDRARSDRAGQDLLIGDEFARTVSNEDVYGALEIFIAQAPADKQPQMRERLRGCKTEADGKRLLGSMFREKAETEWADSQARIAHLNELSARAQHVLRDRLKGDLSVVLPTAEEENELSSTLSSLFENADDRRGFERACEAMALIRAQQSKKHKVFIHSDMPFVSSEVVEEDSYNEGNLLQLRDRLLDYVLDGNKEIDQYALKWLREGLGGFAAELKAKDPNAAERFAVSLTQMIGNVKNFVQDADAEETSWSLIQAMPGLGLPTGPNEMWTPDQYDNAVEVAPVALKRRQEELAAEDPMRAKRLLLAGEINNALTEGLAMPDEASWWEQAYKGAAQMAPQTLPWLLPYVGMPLGAATTYTSESQRGYATGIANFQRAHGRMPNPYEQAGLSLRANQDALLGAAVEVLPGQAVGVPFTRWMSKLTSVRGPAGTLSRIVSRLGERRAAAVGMDIAAGVAEEAVFEPVAQGLLTMGTDAMLDMAGIQGVNRRSVGEAFSELQENYENPGQLGAIVLTVAVLGGGKLPSTLHTADMLRKQNNLLRAAGLSEEGVAQVRSSDDPLKTARELWQKESAYDQNAVLARIRREAAQNKTTGDLLKRTGTVKLANRSEQEAAKASYDFLVEQGLMPKVEEKLDGTFHITEEIGGEGGSVRTKEYDFDAATADAYIAMRAIGANKVLTGAKQALVWGLQDSYIKEIYGEAAAQSIAKQGGKHGIFIREVEEVAGMTPELAEEARTNRFAMTAEWMKKAAATLHDSTWAQRAESFRQRLEMEGLEAGESGTRLFRERSDRQVQVGGKDVFGSILTYVRGQATASDAVEDVFEAVTDMMIQSRAMELLEEDSNMGTQRALQIAVREMADSVRPIIREMALLSSDHSISELAKEQNWADANLYMTTVESLSHIAKSNFLAKRDKLPAAFQSGIDAAANALDYTYEMKQFADAYAAVAKGSKEQIAPLEDLLARQGVIVQDVFREAAVDEQVTASWRKAKGLMGRKSAVDGTGALGVTEAMEQAEQTETEIAEHEAEKAAAPPATADEEASWGDRMKEAATIAEQTPAATAPAEMMGVFRHDACVYNGAAGFYEGWVKVSDLKDSVEIQQVKVGNKGKHGVTNELVGDFQLSAPPIIVWRRLNGDLEVISGRHRYALAEKCNVEYMRADVYQESDVFDARWARLMDYENNMRDDQADEKTAFIYVRETGFTDEELNRKGLLRSRTKSKRGAMIARYAREELATRFMNDAATPMDAEIICNMTRNIRDEERIEEIQRRACMLLDEHKSWEYIGAMVQLMASKESVFMKQGLLDFGVDFEADLARAAKYIEICTKQLNEAIGVMRSGRKLAGKQAKLAQRLGQLTTSAEDTQERLDALTTMKGMFENIGMFPDLVAQAQMWDGEAAIDAVGMALDRGLREVQQDEVLDGMSVEERLEAAEQEAARQAAQEATGSLFSTFSLLHKLDDAYMDALRRGDEETAHKLVLEAAKAGGYVAESDYQGSKAFNGSAPGENGYFETERERYNAWKNGEFEGTISLADFVRNGIDPNNLKWQISDDGAYSRAEDYTRESIDAIRAAKASRSNTITIYRAVPKSVKEKSARNGDWVTLSEAYAKVHITLQDWDGARIIKQTVPMEHVWWDGNDINEWGYDDGKEYAYRNTANNRKSLATVTYDANRNIIPLSQRFNPRKSSVSFSLTVKPVADCIAELCALDADGKPAKSAYLRNTEWGKDILVEWGKKSPKGYKSGVNHIVDRRMSQGLTLDETAFAVVCALTAAQSVQPTERGNRRHFDRFGIRAVVAENSPTDRPLITGFIITPKYKKGAGGTAAPNAGTQPYALNELARTQEVGAALSSALSRFDSIVKQNPSDWEKIIEHEIEMLRIKHESIFDNVFMKAPNGEPTNLTEKQWLTVRTQAFKDWFGDWENDPEAASKVVDENGEPKVVYHGTLESFTSFLEGGLSSRSGGAIWFTDSRKTAEVYGYGGNVMAVFIKALNPRVINAKGKTHREVKSGQRQGTGDIASGLHWSRKKYDSLMFLNIKDYVSFWGEDIPAATSIAVFEPAQIKSATDNRGTFDPAAPDITFSALTASQRREAVQKELALIAVKDEQIATLASDWERMLQNLNKVSRAGESVRLGDGARLYAELLSLISATRAILPPHLAQMGRLNLLMHWAAAYAEMVQHGDLPMRGGAMKGAVAEKFLSAMRKQRDALLLQGLSEEEAREAMAQLGAERLDRSLRKVAVACRDQLNRYVKEQAWERIESIRKRTMPKSEPGHRSKKGKMDSDHYRTMGEIMRALRMTEEQMDEEYQAVVAQMQALTGTEEDYEKRHEKLQDALNILTTYGCWQAMSSAQALKAAESFAEFVATGRNSWKSELDRRKRKNRWMMRRMTENMRKQATPAAVNKEQNKDATGVRRTSKRAALDYIYGLMNFSHLIQAKTRQLGSSMVVRLQDMLLQAQEGKHRETSRRNMMLSMKLREIFGCTSEADAVRVLNELGRQREDHGLRAWKREWQTYTLDREEAEAWVSMTPAERNAVRQRERQEAESQQMVPPDRVPESEMEQLRAVLDEMNNRTRTLSNGESKPSPSKAKTVKLTVKRWGEKAEAETLKVSRLAVANNLLLLEQPGYTSLLEDWGIIRRDASGCELTPGTPEFVTGYDLEATLKPYYDFVGEECMEFCYWMRDYVAEYVTPLTNEAYNRRMGVPLRLLPLYWPGNFNISTMKDTDLLTDQSGGVLGQAASFTINRVRKHHAQADWNTNALSVFYRATDEQLNYVYVGELTQLLRNMFMNDGFVKTLEVNCGVQWVRAVKDQINILDNCVGIEAVNMEAMGKVLSRFFGQLAKDALAFNPKSYTKQASGILNGLTAGLVPRSVIERSDGAKELAYSKIGVMEWAQSLGKVMLGKGKVRLEAMQRREFWQQRYNMSRVEERVRKASTLRSARQSVHAGVIADTGMRVMGAIDRAANIPGLLALADTFYSRLEALNKQHALGMTPAQIEQQALDAVGRALDVGAQPITPEQRASMLATGRGLSKVMLNVATMFKSEIFKDLAQLASQWMSGQWGAAALHYAMRGTFNYGVVCLLWQLCYGGDDDKEDEEWMEAAGKYVLAALSSDLTAVPLLGELPNQLYSYASGTGSWHSTPLVGDISMAYKSSVRLARKGDEMDMQEIMRHSKRILRGLALLSVPFGFGQSRWGSFSDVALDASVIMNSVKVGADVYAAQTK